MLTMLAGLAYEVDPSKLRKVCREIIAISSYNPCRYPSNYFYLLGSSLECMELEMAEQLLELIGSLPETQQQRYAQLISRDEETEKVTRKNIRIVLIELVVKERKEWWERVEKAMEDLGIGKFTSEEMKEEAEGKMWKLGHEGRKHKEEESWVEVDRMATEAQILENEFPPLKNHPVYADCIYAQICSHWKRGDKSQFGRAL